MLKISKREGFLKNRSIQFLLIKIKNLSVSRSFTLYGQLEGTKWFLVAVDKTEIAPGVSRLTGLDVESKPSPGFSDDCQSVGVNQRQRGIVLQHCQPNKTRNKKCYKSESHPDPLSKLTKEENYELHRG